MYGTINVIHSCVFQMEKGYYDSPQKIQNQEEREFNI